MTIYDKVTADQHRYLACDECSPLLTAASEAQKYQRCEHIDQFVLESKDAEYIVEGKHYVRLCMTPVANKVFVKQLPYLDVSIFVTGNPLGGGFRQVALHHPRMLDGSTRVVDLGLLGPNEGRLAVARMAVDFIVAMSHPDESWDGPFKTPCRARSHRYKQQKELDDMLRHKDKQVRQTIKLLVMIALALEGACPPCLISATTDDNYGLDDLPSGSNPSLLARMRANEGGSF